LDLHLYFDPKQLFRKVQSYRTQTRVIRGTQMYSYLSDEEKCITHRPQWTAQKIWVSSHLVLARMHVRILITQVCGAH